MAQQLLEKAIHRHADIQVLSAGTGALVGQQMPRQAQVLARNLGISNPELHLAQSLTVEHLRAADLVIALSREHRRTIVEMLPRGARHTFTLRELARLLMEVEDSDFAEIESLETDDIHGRLRGLVEVTASRRGMVPPPDSPDDDDVVDPYRRDDMIYAVSAQQIVPAITTLQSQIDRAIVVRRD
jgi:protein-tyrosine phosphatase